MVAAPFGMLDVRLYRHLKRLADGASQRARMVPVGLYAASYLVLAVYLGASSFALERMLQRLGPGAFKDANTAAAALTAAHAEIDPAVIGAFESLETTSTGEVVLRGWVVNRNQPGEAFRFRAYCDGHDIGIEFGNPQNAPDIAQSLNRPDLKGRRFGFVIVPEIWPCRAGGLSSLWSLTGWGKGLCCLVCPASDFETTFYTSGGFRDHRSHQGRG